MRAFHVGMEFIDKFGTPDYQESFTKTFQQAKELARGWRVSFQWELIEITRFDVTVTGDNLLRILNSRPYRENATVVSRETATPIIIEDV